MFAGLAQLGHHAGVGPGGMFAGLAQLGPDATRTASQVLRVPHGRRGLWYSREMRGAETLPRTLDTVSPAPLPRSVEERAPMSSGDGEPAADRLGRFRLLRRIGEGGMGVVHAAYDVQLDRVIALKTLRAERNGVDDVSRFIREGQALARLSHPNVVPIYEVGAAGGQVFLAMEYIRGHTLRDVFARLAGPRRAAAVVELMLQAGRGLAAIHSAGLVHRDFKPDNVMVGDDGRVRVMDLGLVRAAEVAEMHDATDSAPDWSSPLTIAGAVLGTPAYMAPEQQLGRVDGRSDVFSFCATLHEGLYGTPPSAKARSGAPAMVPPWLHALVLRGVDRDPELRWPDMEVLLAQLAVDPIARRRQWARRIGLGLVIGGLAVVGTIGCIHLQTRLERQRIEALAAEHLANISAGPGQAPDDVDFAAFVDDRAHQGTRALLQAWWDRGDRRRAAHDVAGALDAYARAYAEASGPADEQATMRGIAGVYLDTWNTPALGRVVQALALDPAVPDDHRLFMTAALRRRDLVGATSWLAAAPADVPAAEGPLLAALAVAHPLGVVGEAAVTLPPGGAARLAVIGDGARKVTLFDEHPTLLRTFTVDSPVYTADATPWAMRSDGEVVTVVDIRTPDVAAASYPAAHDARPMAAFTYGGRTDLYYRLIWPASGFRVIDPEGGTPRVAHAASDATSSDVEAIAAADLDGDGDPELFAAFGPFRAFDLRVFHRGADGELTLALRQTFGRIKALAALRRPDGERALVVATELSSIDAERFPEPPHGGASPGIHLLRWTGASFEARAFLPIAATAATYLSREVLVADLDGDGVDEIIMRAGHFEHSFHFHTLIVRQTADGGLAPLVLGHMWPLATGQFDADPAQELIVRTEPEHAVLVLGLGDTPLEPVPLLAHEVTPPPPALADEILAARWRRADDLAAIGLPRPAAEVLRAAAVFIEDATTRRWFRDRASALFAVAGDLHRALEWSDVGLEVPELATGALTRRIDLLADAGRYREAADAATLLRAHGGDHAVVAAAALRRLTPLLDPANTLELRFDQPLAPDWQVEAPGALHREPATGTLRVEALGDQQRLAALPLTWTGGPLVLELELDVLHAEYNTSFGAALVDAHGAVLMGVGVGGGGHILRESRHHRAWCTPIGHELTVLSVHPVDSAEARHRVTLRISHDPERGHSECVVEDAGERARLLFQAPGRSEPGPLALVLGGHNPPASPNRISVDVRRISVRGANLTPDGADHSAEASAARALVEGDPRAALGLLAATDAPPSDRTPLLRLLADDMLHGLDPAAAAPVLASRSDAELLPLLRARPHLVWGARAALGARFLPLLARAWSELLRHHADDPALQRSFVRELHGLADLAADTQAAQAAKGELLAARGMFYVAIDQPRRAREDLTSALELLSRAPVPGDLTATLHRTLARLLVDTEPRSAHAHALQAVASDRAPELAWELLLADPKLAALLADDPALPPPLRSGVTRAN